ncbi:lactate racemase domain-containing protein [Halanaerobium sp. Z-7514]|uniref:Lactate racemase domain-containing protein n=1 Tax=Halanaerobium polyolivorans TaxID=2886943 RepID=A0AAW4X1T4_9FIRM|nr:lactate racemase domain-containing protein [Halanaerobium polyolivorans]MCC3145776.1 lactate racemase domain-containing protein [Halanaerobium polyolivorans]
MLEIEFEYGEGTMKAELPEDRTEVFVPGETVEDPDHLDNPIEATRESIENPIGMPTIPELVGEGSKVSIIFPDRVKGGFQETAHRKVSIPIIVEKCLEAGVNKEDIVFICSNGLHRKNTKEEHKAILGEEIYNQFGHTGQIINHDSEDWDNLVDLGEDELGDRVILNKHVYESDLAVLIGHTLGNPYGGYSGGYKHSATGITTWESIASHHVPEVMHRDDFTPISSHSLMRKKFNAISQHMEKKMGNKFFCCDAVLDTEERQIAVFSGYGKELQKQSWEVADKRNYVPWAEEKFDVVMFGMPQNFHYGNGHGTNPLLILQAIAANVIRHKRVLNDNFVIIVSSICNGYFHDEEFPSYREVYELFQKDYNYTLPDLNKYGEYVAKKQEYIDKYRFNFGYHPFHAFSMISCGHIAKMHASEIYMVGAYEPGYARGMGMNPLATFEDALKDAEKHVGKNPNILALPKAFKRKPVHLMMKEEEK